MRRYFQGTLDFSCGMYAVMNALALIYNLDLSGGRRIFSETVLSLSEEPALWKHFLRNETDHYWLVRYMLQRWCCSRPWKFTMFQPFSDSLLPVEDGLDLHRAEIFLPESEQDDGPLAAETARKEALAVWSTAEGWIGEKAAAPPNRTALLRFHRFYANSFQPVVSHWTTVSHLENDVLHLHDACSEPTALVALEKNALLPADGSRSQLRIVPESLMLLERDS